MDITLRRMTIYPIKSLDGCDVGEAGVLPSGALEHDRRWVLVDDQGRWLNGKRTAAVHRIRATYSDPVETVTLACDGQAATFSLFQETEAAGRWLSERLGTACHLEENAIGGFPDDTDAPGPTLISTASLEAVAGWWDGLTLEQARLRFRANLEVGPSPAFWEDRLVGEAAEPPTFRVGEVLWQGMNVCQRCVVPTRHPVTGEVIDGFVRQFTEHREQTLPDWAPASRFDHFYRLSINTRLVSPREGGRVRVGDRVEMEVRG